MQFKMGEPNLQKPLDDSKEELPSNESVVDSLVKDFEEVNLKKQLTNNVSHSSSDLGCGDSEQFGEEILNSEKTKCKDDMTNSCDGNDGEENARETKKTENHDDDFIDEDYLKDLEVGYSEEDKKKLKEEAEELKNNGNSHFKDGEYKAAALSYTNALRICPLAFEKNRAILYANRGAAKSKLFLKESAIEDCTKAVELDPQYLKVYVRRAQLYEETDKLDEALEDYKKILEIDSLHRDALFASKRLAEQINERNEKLKTEMLGKLKDLGNMFLKPFGLSTNNFQMVQDPNTGGYSINFSQNQPNHS